MSRDALVVGINTYKYSGFRDLTAPAKDAEAIARLLESDGEFQVTRLPAVIDKPNHGLCVGQTTKVTATQLKKALVKLFKPQGTHYPQTGLLFFSGHGWQQENMGMEEGYLATSDSNPEQNQLGISLQSLRQLLQKSPVREQIIWLDCCHAGELMDVEDANPGEQAGYSRCFIASSRGFEESLVVPDGKHSVLTEALLHGLKAPDRRLGEWVTNYTLIDSIHSYLKSHHRTIPQRPIFTNTGPVINLIRKLPSHPFDITPGPVSKPEGCTELLRPPDPPEPSHPINEPSHPFDITPGPVSKPEDFLGRTELLRQLFEELAKGSNISLVGPARVGKSSILKMICHWGPERLGLSPEQFINLDMRTIRDENEFFEALCDELKIETCRGYKLARALRGKRYILCLDEIDQLRREEHFTGDERTELCGLADGADKPFSLVIASQKPLQDLFPDSPVRTSPLAGICLTLDVQPFSGR